MMQLLGMHISNNKYRLAKLTFDNLRESAALLADEFMAHNKVWGAVQPTPEQIHWFMYEKTKEMLEWEEELRQDKVIPSDCALNFVYLNENDEIVAVATSFELTQYLSKTSKVDLPHFKVIEGYGKELEKTIHPKDMIPGRNIYGMFGCIRSELAGNGIVLLFWLDYAHYLHERGFRYLYGRCSSVKTYYYFLETGGYETARLKVRENGREVTLTLVKWPLDDIRYLQHTVNKYKAKARL